MAAATGDGEAGTSFAFDQLAGRGIGFGAITLIGRFPLWHSGGGLSLGLLTFRIAHEEILLPD